MAPNPTPHFLLLGGFLGAGKTTAARKLAEFLMDQGLRVGLITNDQGSELVDTQLLRACGLATAEVPGGCFCCRFDALIDASLHLISGTGPDVLIAEAVGSCTDLAATVTYPLRRLFGERYTVGPLSVLVDPVRARQVLDLADDGAAFSDNVRYIYLKQLEEADVIVIGKQDLLEQEQRLALRAALEMRFPQAEIFEISARHDVGLEPWFRRIVFTRQVARQPIDVDYQRYAEGEARLGWLNALVRLGAAEPADGNAVLAALAMQLQRRLAGEQAEIAHLKMTLHPSGDDANARGSAVAAINLVRGDHVPELSATLPHPVTRANIIVNLRAEGVPDALSDSLGDALVVAAQACGVELSLAHCESFSPSPPVPTHRETVAPA